jgi:hypothetical protein
VATALAQVQWIAALDWTAASRLSRDDLAVPLFALTAALPPIDQQVFSVQILNNAALDTLTAEQLYLVSQRVVALWAANH